MVGRRDLDPGNLEIQNNLAVLYFVREENEAAIRLLEHIVAQDATYVEGWLNLGIVYAKSGRPEEARRAWQNVLRHQPENEAAKAYLARQANL